MRLKSLVSGIGMIAATAGISLMLTACPSKITEEQLAQLQELRRKERSLIDDIGKRNTELKKLETELNSRKAELKKCEEEKAFVKGKLAEWPNVWPDYSPSK